MKHRFAGSLQLLVLLAWFGALTALPAMEDRVIGVAKADPEMIKAIADARAKLPYFWQVMAEAKDGEEDFPSRCGSPTARARNISGSPA